MNKNLIAISIAAALAAPSIASADVKLIGRVQLELVNTSGDTASGEGITLDDSYEGGKVGSGNASGIGAKGSHDLGNGMTGIFKAYLNFSPDNGAGGLGKARDMYVGLKGGFGTVLAGRIATPYKTSTVKWDGFNATFLQARGNNGRSRLHNGYANDVIAYANKFGSVKFVGAIALDETVDGSGSINGDHTLTFSLNMPVADNMELALAYLDATAADDGTAIKVGLKWKSGDLTISGQYETLGKDISDPNVGEQDSLYLNGSMKMGGGSSITLGLGQLSDSANNDGSHVSLGYKNKMSKTVTAYAGVIAISDGVLGNGNSTTQIGGGVRVSF